MWCRRRSRRCTSSATRDWAQIAALYGQLVLVDRSPVVALNRAIAVGEAHGPAAGLELLDALDLPD